MKSVLVTGGSSGIGAAFAKAAAKAGYHVIIGYHSGRMRAEKLTQEITAASGTAHCVNLPLISEEAIDRAIGELKGNLETLDSVVLCASPQPALTAFTKTGADQLLNELRVNVVFNHHLLVQLWKTFFR